MMLTRFMRKTLGEFVKEKREALGLSQRALAKKAKISPTVINRLEAGETSPSTATLEGIALALNVPLYKLTDILQGRATKEGKDTLSTLIESLSPGKRKFLEEITQLLVKFENEL